MLGRTLTHDTLHYTARTHGEYRDLRQFSLRVPRCRVFPRGREFRISFNGIYRSPKSTHDMHRYANPGWSLGAEHCYLNWTHYGKFFFRRRYYHGPMHLSLVVGKRGITLSTHTIAY